MMMYNSFIMIRTQIYITEKQKISIQMLANMTGLRMSDVIRRIIDKHFEECSHDYKPDERNAVVQCTKCGNIITS